MQTLNGAVRGIRSRSVWSLAAFDFVVWPRHLLGLQLAEVDALNFLVLDD